VMAEGTWHGTVAPALGECHRFARGVTDTLGRNTTLMTTEHFYDTLILRE